jgi:hypothetical protein
MFGPDIENENHPEYLAETIDTGFDVEIDLWIEKTKIFLGHDEPQYPVDPEFLYKHYDKIWVHCKNVEALEYLGKTAWINWFWHDKDDYTITSQNHLWCHPNAVQIDGAICQFRSPLIKAELPCKPYAVCTDWPCYLKEKI